MFIVPSDKKLKKLFFYWLSLAISSLAFSGIYSFFPYALRTPSLSTMLNMNNLFDYSLMIHVNLGVLVWFFSIASMLTTSIIQSKYITQGYFALIFSVIGTVLIILSPFIGKSVPVKNNYIPILHNLTFIIGISLFLCGALLQFILGALNLKQIKQNIFNLIIYYNGLIFFIAVVCFIKAYFSLQSILETRSMYILEYYELLFWSSGHILQFVYSQLIIYAWIVLTLELKPKLNISFRFFSITQLVNFLFIIIALLPCWIYSIDSFEFYNFFTNHMKYCGGILLFVVAVWTIISIPKNIKKFEFICFICSAFLILSGGIIGYLIKASNVTVPAHYHGVILGITVSLMGLCYTLLPKLGFKEIKNKLAIWQLFLYTFGQFIHILALAISGGYGALRKDPNTTVLSAKAKIYMGVMGMGGTIALFGGILFVVLMFRNMRVHIHGTQTQ